MPAEWRTGLTSEQKTALKNVREVLTPLLRDPLNRLLEGCRGEGHLGASLEAQVQLLIDPSQDGGRALQTVLQAMEASPHSDVDNLADWLLVSAVAIGGDATDIGQHSAHPSLCGRCGAVLAGGSQAGG